MTDKTTNLADPEVQRRLCDEAPQRMQQTAEEWLRDPDVQSYLLDCARRTRKTKGTPDA